MPIYRVAFHWIPISGGSSFVYSCPALLCRLFVDGLNILNLSPPTDSSITPQKTPTAHSVTLLAKFNFACGVTVSSLPCVMSRKLAEKVIPSPKLPLLQFWRGERGVRIFPAPIDGYPLHHLLCYPCPTPRCNPGSSASKKKVPSKKTKNEKRITVRSHFPAWQPLQIEIQ